MSGDQDDSVARKSRTSIRVRPPRLQTARSAQTLQHCRTDDTAIVAEDDAPDGLAGLGELADLAARLVVPELDAAVVAAGDDKLVVELEAGDRVVVGAEAVDALERGEAEDDHPAVRAAGDEDRVGQLELADERRVPLEQREAVAGPGRPNADGRVERAGRDAVAVEGDRVDLVEVAAEDELALARVDVPELSRQPGSYSADAPDRSCRTSPRRPCYRRPRCSGRSADGR